MGLVVRVKQKVIRHRHLLTSTVLMMMRPVDLHLVEVGAGGKEPMVEDTPSDLARDIGLGVNMGSTQKGSSGKK